MFFRRQHKLFHHAIPPDSCAKSSHPIGCRKRLLSLRPLSKEPWIDQSIGNRHDGKHDQTIEDAVHVKVSRVTVVIHINGAEAGEKQKHNAKNFQAFDQAAASQQRVRQVKNPDDGEPHHKVVKI
jgi:hypothetical protein